MNQPENGSIARPLDRFATSCGWMREEFSARQIPLRPMSSLARGLHALEKFRARIVIDDYQRFETTDAAYDALAQVYGVDFLTKAIHWGITSGLSLDEARWRLLGKGDPIITRTSETSSSERNKTWEIILASLASTFATEVEFAEPDVTCTYAGRRYAIAAKVAYSNSNVIENIEKGFKQARAKADAVLVFVNTVSLYPQVETLRWSRYRRFAHAAEGVEVMKASVERWCNNWPFETLAKRLRAEASEPVGVAFFVPMLLHLDGAPRPFWYTHMPLVWDQESPDYEFARAFVRRCNVVADFVPGVAMGLP